MRIFNKLATQGRGYSIPMINLSEKPVGQDSKYDSLYQQVIIDDETNYMAHPDAVLLKSGDIMAMYPEGHGKGNVVARRSSDGGLTWSARLSDTPKSWSTSRETPTVYRLNFNDGSEKIVMISANPQWNIPGAGDGFNASFSEDDGVTWTEFSKFFGKGDPNWVQPIVAMASLTRLKGKDGAWRDAWMGFFHDNRFHNYKTILTFENGKMQWSIPQTYLAQYRKIEKYYRICEVEVVRSEGGNGKQLVLLGRSNGNFRCKFNNSCFAISDDEGESWSEPKELSAAINGERHKADYLSDGRLFITFRSIERDIAGWQKSCEKNGKKLGRWYSHGWVAWVGKYEDLISGGEGEYRIKLAHTYLKKNHTTNMSANADTGYCGNAALKGNKVFTSTYGSFGQTYNDVTGATKLKTYIIGKTLNIKLVDELIKKI